MKRIELWDNDLSFKEQMDQIYKWFDQESQYPNFVSAYIYYLLEEESNNNNMKLTEAEFVYFFTGIESEDDFQYYNSLTIEGIIKDLCIKAKEKKELSIEISNEQIAKVFLAFLVGPFITHKGLEPYSAPGELFNIMLEGFV